MRLLAAIATVAACLIAGEALAFDAGVTRVIEGTVTRVSDGDTLWVRPDRPPARPLKVRLHGIDAPERCQAWGERSTAALAGRLLHRRVQVHWRARDDYGRTLGRVLIDGTDVGAWMVAQGHAWSARWRHRPGPYAQQEADAHAARRGLFADPLAIEPRRFRARHGACG